MRIAVLVLGILGGILGIAAAVFLLALGSIVGLGGGSDPADVAGRTFGTLGFAIVGIVGSALVGSKAKLSGGLMLFSAIGGLFVSGAYLFPAPFLFIGGILALFARPSEPKVEYRETIVFRERG